MRKTRYYIAAAITLDGFIAKNRSHRSTWTSKEDKLHLHKMISRADAIIMTRNVYAHAKKSREKPCIVITRSVKGIEERSEKLTFLNSRSMNIEKYIRLRNFRNICILGGTFVYSLMMEKGLVDEIYLTVEPAVFGEGLGLFGRKINVKKFKLISAKKLNKKGTLLLHYKVLT